MGAPSTPRRYFAFGSFRLDPVNRVLFRDGEILPLSPKAIDTLLVLIEHRGAVVSKEDLLKAVWPDTFVEEGSLTHNISLLRKDPRSRLCALPGPRRPREWRRPNREWRILRSARRDPHESMAHGLTRKCRPLLDPVLGKPTSADPATRPSSSASRRCWLRGGELQPSRS